MHLLERWRREEELRRGKPLRRYQLAKEFGCSPSRLTQIIHGGDMPSSDLAIRMKQVTGLSTDEILGVGEPEVAE